MRGDASSVECDYETFWKMKTFIIKSFLLYMMSLVPVDLLVKVIQNTTNDCKAFRLSLLKPKDQSYRPDGLPNQALSVPEIKR